ncbi:22942_t:CDS:2, partial [Cetraspora pellucida]
VNETVKTISNAFGKVGLRNNDLLLSGILDIESLDAKNSPIKEALIMRNLWSDVKETIKIKLLPDGLKEFINEHVKTGDAVLPAYNKDLYRRTRCLIDAMDSVPSKATLERNDSKGPIKMNDIFGIYESEDLFNLELLLGEVSNGPFNQTSKAQKHIKDDKSKLSKCGKDALDHMIKKYMRSQKCNTENLKNLKVFLLHAHGTSLDLFIVDRNIVPFSRLRKLKNVKIPYKSNSTNELVELIRALYTFSILIEKNLELIKSIEKECKSLCQNTIHESSDGNDESSEQLETYLDKFNERGGTAIVYKATLQRKKYALKNLNSNPFMNYNSFKKSRR